MKWVQVLLLSLSLCSYSLGSPDDNKTYLARVTFYWPGSAGQTRAITSTGEVAKHLQTCAVNPKEIPYGTNVFVHDMNITVRANDTGAWVVRRVAAKRMGKNVPVIDIFVSSRAQADVLIKKYPHFMKITIK
jgi:3D (Asp-Asp-Asp) domain-containing protein